jgi:hypothetical protein
MPESERSDTLLTILLSPDTHRLFKTKCSSERTTMTDVIRTLIQRWLNGEIETH